MAKIAGLGVNIIDYYKDDQFCYFGGNEYNIVNFVKQLNGTTSYIGVFSTDKAGTLLKKNLEEQNIDTSHSKMENGSCGYAIVKIVKGERYFESWNKAGVADLYPIDITIKLITFLKTFEITCISSYSRLSLEKIIKLKNNNICLSYDFSENFKQKDLENICPLVFISFFSLGNIKDRTQIKIILKQAYELGSKIAIATLGKGGSMAYDGKDFYFQKSLNINSSDTMGAGDSFIAAFLSEYLNNKDLKKALIEGNAFAAKQVSVKGSLNKGFPIEHDNFWDFINPPIKKIVL